MKISFEQIKGKLKMPEIKKPDFSGIKGFDLKKISTVSRNFIIDYHKTIGYAAVIAALVTVCGFSLVNKIQDKNTPSGVMMTLSSVAEGEKPFAGNTFDVAAISYDDMVNVSYESSQLAQLEISEKQIDEILSAKRQDEKDQAVYDALTAQHQTAETVATYENAGIPQQVVAVTTYADANGTYTYAGEFILTAYCPCPICCGQWSNISSPTTASGAIAVQGVTVAADTSVFAFGTQLNINGQIYTVQDTGGAIKGNRIDIYFNSHAEALAFGKQAASVYTVQ